MARVEAVHNQLKFTNFDAFLILLSMVFYLFDIYTDLDVAAFHYINKNFWYDLID